MLDFKNLIPAGVHFGHPRTRWCPKMKPYIWGIRNDVHLIDVSKTAKQADKAAQFLQATAAEGKTILWVGTKKAAREIVYTYAKQLNMPYVNHRWIGGTISNWDNVKKSLTKLLHYEDILAKTDKTVSLYTKKEFSTFQKIVDKLSKSIGGIRKLKLPIGALVVVDVRKERSAIKEASSMGIPVVALVDTDGDPSLVDYVIPANDDAPRSINIIIEYLAAAAAKGKEVADKNQAENKASAAESASANSSDDKNLVDEDLEESDAKAKTTKTAGKVSQKGPQRRAHQGGRSSHKGGRTGKAGESFKKSE